MWSWEGVGDEDRIWGELGGRVGVDMIKTHIICIYEILKEIIKYIQNINQKISALLYSHIEWLSFSVSNRSHCGS